MAVLSILGASFCQSEELAGKAAEKLGFEYISSEKLLETASNRFEIEKAKLNRAMRFPPSVFNKFTHEKERNLAYLRATMAELLEKDKLVHEGFMSLLVPKAISHMLRICLVAGNDYRVKLAQKIENISEKEAERIIKKDDNELSQWTKSLFELGPWDKSLYDIIIPMHSTSFESALEIIIENIGKPALKTTPTALQAVKDFQLASKVNIVLAEKGYDLDVTSRNGVVTLVINKYILRLDQFEEKVEQIARSVPGVEDVNVTIGPKFHQPNIYMRFDVEIPPKILLVDDEKDFVHTLSERLETRDIDSAVAYNGEEALSIVENDAPEVMVLDLKMPGIDGIEVLRQTKMKHPDTEVIILTGHGSEKEEVIARELGAFAYLRKPVDIEVLTKTMKEAYQKVHEKTSAKKNR